MRKERGIFLNWITFSLLQLSFTSGCISLGLIRPLRSNSNQLNKSHRESFKEAAVQVHKTFQMKCTNTPMHACEKAQMSLHTHTMQYRHAQIHLHTHRHTLNSYEPRRWSRSILAWWFIHLLLAITEDIVSAPPINLCYFPQHRALESTGSQWYWRWSSSILTVPRGTCTAVTKRQRQRV